MPSVRPKWDEKHWVLGYVEKDGQGRALKQRAYFDSISAFSNRGKQLMFVFFFFMARASWFLRSCYWSLKFCSWWRAVRLRLSLYLSRVTQRTSRRSR